MAKKRFSTAKTMGKLCFLLIIFSVNSIATLCQNPPESFFKGLDLLTTDQKEAKKQFLIALGKDSLFYGTYHFLGVIYLDENKIDSAIHCFKRSIQLNRDNLQHTKEMTYVRLIDTYLYQHDFDNSFSIAWEAFKQYPENTSISQGLKDVCLWSFYTKYNDLDLSYLSSSLKDEYVVNSVPEEYLILRKIKIDDQYLIFERQYLITKKKASYDIIECSLSESHTPYEIKFKLNWDLDKYFGGHVANTDPVYSNANNPIYERIGALLVSDSKIDLRKETESLIE